MKSQQTLWKKRFYEEVFGWKITQAAGPIEYWVIQTVPVDPNGKLLRAGVNGGMYKKQGPESKPLNYFDVESITDFLEDWKVGREGYSAQARGPEIGWIASAEDPEGNFFALIQPIRV